MGQDCLAVQSISFNFFPLRRIAGFIIRLFIAFATVRLVKDFPRIYINVMYGICIISLCFYVPEQLFHAVGRDFASLFMPLANPVRDFFCWIQAIEVLTLILSLFLSIILKIHIIHIIYIEMQGRFGSQGHSQGIFRLRLFFLD